MRDDICQRDVEHDGDHVVDRWVNRQDTSASRARLDLVNPTVTASIIGARTRKQSEDNLGALDVPSSDAQRIKLAEVSAIELGFPHEFIERPMHDVTVVRASLAMAGEGR